MSFLQFLHNNEQADDCERVASHFLSAEIYIHTYISWMAQFFTTDSSFYKGEKKPTHFIAFMFMLILTHTEADNSRSKIPKCTEFSSTVLHVQIY